MAKETKYGQVTTERKRIPEDEPVFLLRAQDKLAAEAIGFYAELRRKAGDEEGGRACLAVAKTFRAWPKKKMPD